MDDTKETPFALAIHGGAGTILPEHMTPELLSQYESTLQIAVLKGYSILVKGGSSLDSVTETIQILEDSPLFNAGKGSVFTHAETNEMDASIMLGNTLQAGAVCGVSRVKNPILLAREVMMSSNHVMLSGKGAEEFAQLRKIELVEPSYFYTEKRFNDLQKVKDSERYELDHNAPGTKNTTISSNSNQQDSKFGTVGCVALDKHGNLCAGTSTGGMTNKRWSRIGDSPIIGSGTYANNKTCAVSSTGWGEHFIRNVVAYDVSAIMEYAHYSLDEAAKKVIHEKVKGTGGDGGVVAIDKNGNISFEFNTTGMYRASVDKNGHLYIGIYRDLSN